MNNNIIIPSTHLLSVHFTPCTCVWGPYIKLEACFGGVCIFFHMHNCNYFIIQLIEREMQISYIRTSTPAPGPCYKCTGTGPCYIRTSTPGPCYIRTSTGPCYIRTSTPAPATYVQTLAPAKYVQAPPAPATFILALAPACNTSTSLLY